MSHEHLESIDHASLHEVVGAGPVEGAKEWWNDQACGERGADINIAGKVTAVGLFAGTFHALEKSHNRLGHALGVLGAAAFTGSDMAASAYRAKYCPK